MAFKRKYREGEVKYKKKKPTTKYKKPATTTTAKPKTPIRDRLTTLKNAITSNKAKKSKGVSPVSLTGNSIPSVGTMQNKTITTPKGATITSRERPTGLSTNKFKSIQQARDKGKIPKIERKIPRALDAKNINYEDMKETKDFAATDYMKNIKTYEKPKPYESKMSPQIMDTLGMINQRTQEGFKFDNNDIVLKQLQDQAMERVRQDMAKRGRVFDTFAATKEQEAAQRMIPDVYRLRRGDYDKDLSNMYSQLNAQQGIDNTGYGRYQDYNRADRDYTTGQRQDYMTSQQAGQQEADRQYNFSQGQYEQELKDRQEKQLVTNALNEQYGNTLSPTMRSYVDQFANINREDAQRLLPYQGNYAGRILELRATDPTSPDIPMLESLRAIKILSNPELLAQYGAEYGMQTQDILQAGQQAEQERLNNQILLDHEDALRELEIIKQKYANTKAGQEIIKVQAEIEKLIAEANYKTAQANKADWEAKIKQIEASNLPREYKLKFKELGSSIAKNYASAESFKASASYKESQKRIGEDKYVTDRMEQDKESEPVNNVGIALGNLFGVKFKGNLQEFLKSEAAAYSPEELKAIVNIAETNKDMSSADMWKMIEDINIKIKK